MIASNGYKICYMSILNIKNASNVYIFKQNIYVIQTSTENNQFYSECDRLKKYDDEDNEPTYCLLFKFINKTDFHASLKVQRKIK